jgi:FimV-like protein
MMYLQVFQTGEAMTFLQKRMLRCVFSLALMVLSLLARAAELGKLTVLSSLGEPLVAEIELALPATEKAAGLAVKLAPAESFKAANIPLRPALADLRFHIEPQAERQVVRVTSVLPMLDPALDVLLELSWAGGRQQRQYTISLERPARQLFHVQQGDTLSRIASLLKPADVSLERMLASLYLANPSAFHANDMSRLKAGSVLAVPDPDQLRGTSQEWARIVVAGHGSGAPPMTEEEARARVKELEKNLHYLEKLMAAKNQTVLASNNQVVTSTSKSPSKAKAAAPAAPPDAEVLASFKNLPVGSGVVSAPQTVQRGETFSVILKVSRASAEQAIKEMRAKYGADLQVKGQDGIKLSRWMTATLHAPDLAVQPSGPVRQSLDEKEGATWEWLVSGNKAGKFRLLVEATVEVERGSKADVHRFFSYSQNLTVQVGPMDWLLEYWQWLAGAIVIPGGGLLWKWWKKRRPHTPNWDG